METKLVSKEKLTVLIADGGPCLGEDSVTIDRIVIKDVPIARDFHYSKFDGEAKLSISGNEVKASIVIRDSEVISMLKGGSLFNPAVMAIVNKGNPDKYAIGQIGLLRGTANIDPRISNIGIEDFEEVKIVDNLS